MSFLHPSGEDHMTEESPSILSAPSSTLKPFPAWQAYILAFTASACTMTIELVAGRMMSPMIGVSLYTWTSIIGVVLAGISIGNYIGGKIADRFASRRTLFILFLISGVLSLSILYTTHTLAGMKTPATFPIMARIVILTGSIFFLPACALGTISPLLVKLSLRNLERSGDIVGKIYAISTAGSILGTFATGFWLVSWFGTRSIVIGVSVICCILALVFGDWSWFKKVKSGAPVAALLLLVGWGSYFILTNSPLQSDCLRETNYYCIKVFDQTIENQEMKVLVLDHLVHSYNSIDDPQKLTYPYEYTYAAFTEYIARQRPNQQVSALFIGGGGYTFPRYIQSRYKGSLIDVFEIDPEVTEIVKREMGLEPGDTIRTTNMDARLALEMLPEDQKFDLVIGDAFHGVSVPYHLTTKEFNDMVKAHLKPNGIYMLNIIDGRKALFARSEVRTFRQTFPYVAIQPINEQYQDVSSALWVVIGSNAPIDMEKYLSALQVAPRPDITQRLWQGSVLDDFLASGDSILITDDFSPVDNLLAAVFEERGY
jgi:spermidine synthase